MEFSVLICTHQRAAELDLTLQSLARLYLPNDMTWEVVVVDNASTDRTPAVIDSWRSRPLPIRSVAEPKLGIQHARNAALREGRGDLFVFLDDDVTADPQLLAAYRDAARLHPDVTYFGGRIIPTFDHDPSPLALTMLRQRPTIFSRCDLSPTMREMGPLEGGYSANLCLRRSKLMGCTFEPGFGHIGGDGVSGEETAYLYRLAKAGAKGLWVPGAMVQHRIGVGRTTWKYAERCTSSRARGVMRLELLEDRPERPVTRRELFWWWREAIKRRARALLAGPWVPLDRRFALRHTVWQRRAQLLEARKFFRQGRR